MADSEIEQGDTDEEGGSQKRGKKMGLFAGLAALLIAGGIGGAYFFGVFDGLVDESTGEPTEQASKEDNAAAAKIAYYQLPEFLVNLSGSTTQTSFIKMRVTLELPSEKDLLIAQERLPRLQDTFNTYLRDLRPSDLAGTAGMYRLKEELLARANHTLAPEGRVNHILFTEILVQ